MGMAASGNIGARNAMFEPVHGSVPKYEGQDKVNPLATILAVHMMLGWLGETRRDKGATAAGRDLEAAVEAHLKEGKVLTYDLGGKARTSQVGDALVIKLRAIAGKR
jgi:isocitrate/isopropylmalate dehydrogenase